MPANLQMIFNRRGIDLFSQEDIGNALGLIIPPDVKDSFKSPKIVEEVPDTGYGTRIHMEEFGLSSAFKKWGLPLRAEFCLIDDIKDADDLKSIMHRRLEGNDDLIMCFASGAFKGEPSDTNGHVVLCSKADDKNISFTDPGAEDITVSYDEMYRAMKHRTAKNFGGIWAITSKTP